MTKDVFILGGARTPMTEYTGALKDVSALELGAIAARGAFEKTRRQARVGRSRRRRQRAADEQRRDLRRAPRRAQGRRADRGAGADGQPAVRLGHPGGGQRRAADSARRGRDRPDRRHREHEPGAARDSRLRSRPEARVRASSRTPSTRRCSIPYCGLFMAQTAEKCAGQVRHLARGAGRVRAAQPAAGRRGLEQRAASPTRSCRSRSRRARASTVVDKDDHLRPDTTLEGLAKLPAAFSKDGTVTAGNASGIVDGGAALILASERAVSEKGLTPLARLRRLGGGRRRSVDHGDGAGAGDAQGARARRADARRTSI